MSSENWPHRTWQAKNYATGRWREQRHECSYGAAGKPLCFKVAAFVAKVDALGSQRAGGGDGAP